MINEDSMNVDNYLDDSTKLLIDEDAHVAKDEIVTEEGVEAVVLPTMEDLNKLGTWLKETNDKRRRLDEMK